MGGKRRWTFWLPVEWDKVEVVPASKTKHEQTERCGGSGRLIRPVVGGVPPHQLRHIDGSEEYEAKPCPGCPDCQPETETSGDPSIPMGEGVMGASQGERWWVYWDRDSPDYGAAKRRCEQPSGAYIEVVPAETLAATEQALADACEWIEKLTQERDEWEATCRKQAEKHAGEIGGWTGRWLEAVARAEAAERRIAELEDELADARQRIENDIRAAPPEANPDE